MCNKSGIVLLLFLIAASGASAQNQDRFLVYTYSGNGKAVYEIASTGAILSTVAPLPTNFRPLYATMSENNRTYYILGQDYSTPGFSAMLEFTPGGVVKTLVTGPGLWETMYLNDDGEWIILSYASAPASATTFFRVRGGKVTGIGQFYAWVPGMTMDEQSGQLIGRTLLSVHPMKYAYCHIDTYHATLTTFAAYKPGQNWAGGYGARDLIYDASVGAVIDNTYVYPIGTRLVQVLPETGIVPFPGPTVSANPRGLVLAGQRTSSHKYVMRAQYTALNRMDLLRFRADGTLHGFSSIPSIFPFPDSSFARIGSRHLRWALDAPPNGRTLHLDFPGELGLSYAVGLSLTGIRPGIILKDNRVIPLVPDSLTLLSVQGGIPGVLENTTGVLNIAGHARVKVNTNGLGGNLRGVKIWATALVLDPNASAGIAYIAGPKLLTLK